MALVLRYAARSDVGLRPPRQRGHGYADDQLLVVADGMGGHAAGELASATAIATLREMETAELVPTTRSSSASPTAVVT